MSEALKVCRHCGEAKPLRDFARDRAARDGLRSWCRPCTNARKSQWRTENPAREREQTRRWRAENRQRVDAYDRRDAALNPEKHEARVMLNRAVRGGRIVRPDACETCATAGPVHGHHDDYSKPLEVRWLCPPCHRKIHDEETSHV